jgi:hypothetical protein
MEITTANATSYAIVIEMFIDEVLWEYSDAIDLSFGMTNMLNLLYIHLRNGYIQSTDKNSIKEKLC